MRLDARVRERIRQEMDRRGLHQSDVAGFTGWSQSKVAKLLNARMVLTVDALEGLAFAVGLTPVEVVRDWGKEFCAELTSTELRLLHRLRERPQDAQAVHQLLLGRAELEHAKLRRRRNHDPRVHADLATGTPTPATPPISSRQAPGTDPQVSRRRKGDRAID